MRRSPSSSPIRHRQRDCLVMGLRGQQHPTLQSPNHTYGVGTYTVTLNASNDYGFSIETKIDYITVLAPPAAALQTSPWQCARRPVHRSEHRQRDCLVMEPAGIPRPCRVHLHLHECRHLLCHPERSNAYGHSISAPTTITVLDSPAAAFCERHCGQCVVASGSPIRAPAT